MATLAEPHDLRSSRDDRFFMRSAIAMAIVIIAGFSTQLALGRSSFSSPPLVHAHAIIFMGWVTLFVLQNVFATTGNIALHRRLGWIGSVWIVAMIVLGLLVVVAILRRGQVQFFFRPIHFLVFDSVSLLTFAGLTYAAIRMRRQTDWHRRLHFCGMSLLLGPGFGRLLPMPLLAPWAWEATFVSCLIFPIIGIIADIRRSGHVHKAWLWGIATMLGSFVMIETVTYSPAGEALYRIVTNNSPGAAVDPMAFPPPPSGPQITGRIAGE